MRLTNKCPTRSLAILRFALPAQVVKLVDTLASGASARKGVEVQVLSSAPIKKEGSQTGALFRFGPGPTPNH